MAAVFLKLLNLSISASWLVLAVLALRLVSKRSPKWMNVLLWGIVALRLMLPFSIESALSLIPSAETVSPAVVQFDPAPTITSGVSVINNAVNPALSEHFAAAPTASVNPLYVWTEIAGWVWLIGLGAMLLYALVSYLRLRRRVSVSLCVRENIYLCDAISSPFILGVVKPRIYLPSGLDEVQRQNVLSHEQAHLARRDHWWKPLGFALLAVYWFNPALWLAYTLLCRDIELACDERVIRTMDESAVKTYSTVLLACSMPRKAVITCPLAFGEVGVKERVKNALRYKKPAFWVVAASVAVCVVVAVCFLTNPPTDTDAAGLVGFHREQVTYADVTGASGAQPSNVQLTAEETDAVYALLDALQYKRLGAASAMEDCYARLYFISAAGERCEIMLSEREMLVNPITDGRKARLYELRSGGTVLKNYVKWCINRKDPTVPEDLFDQIDQLLCDMPLGEYVLGEVVFEDSAWEASYAETFDEGPADLRVGGACSLAGPHGASSGYYYRFSTWEEITLKKSNFDWLFRSGSGEDWNGTSAAKLRRENVRAWRGTRTAEDDNATAPLERYLRWDELTAMDQWLLLQQKDGSLYLVMGYRSGGLPYSGAHPYRWIVRLNGGATELTRADLNGDGIEEVISYTGTSTQEPYRLRVSNQSGEELWSAELGLAHAGWSSYFLYRDSVKTALLRYEPTIYQGEASYSYELFMLSENGTTTLAENSVSFSINLDSKDPWPAEAQKFADEVNRLLDKSELLFSTLNAELHCYGDGTVIRCAEPSESDGSRALASADLDNDGRAE